MVIQLPAIKVANALAVVCLLLLVPQVEPVDPLPVGGWVLLQPHWGQVAWRSFEVEAVPLDQREWRYLSSRSPLTGPSSRALSLPFKCGLPPAALD